MLGWFIKCFCLGSNSGILLFLRAEIMSKNERRRTPCLTATGSLAFFRRTLCHKTREQEAVLFRFSEFWSKQGSCSDLNQKAKKQDKLSSPPDSWESQLFSVFLWSAGQRKTEKVDFLRSRGGGNSIFRSVLSFLTERSGTKLGSRTNARRVPCR